LGVTEKAALVNITITAIAASARVEAHREILGFIGVISWSK
jgi:hypothetical protein